MDSLFFWLSKLIWLFLSPDSLLLVLFAAGLLLLWLDNVLWARRLLLGVFSAFLLIGLFPVGEWLLYPLENRYPVNPELDKVDGIIVLSGALDPVRSALWDQVVVGGASERNFAFIELARKFPAAKLVYSGGSGRMINQQYKAADVARRLFNHQGMDLSRILFERESRNTWENGLFSKKLVNPKMGEKWVLITTAWHMPRAVSVFCKIGWDVIPFPVDYQSERGNLLRVDWGGVSNMSGLAVGVKAWVGQWAYWFSEKSC